MTLRDGPSAPIAHDRVVTLSPLVRRITQNNPGPFTGPGTNTHLVGTTSVFILDPGEDRDDGHFELITAAVGAATVAGVLPSHGHPDHWPLAPRLAEHFKTPLTFRGTHPEFRTDRSIADGDRLEAGGVCLDVLHTPGHTADHVCLLLAAERALFPGDHVMGWSTSVIAPPEGDLTLYLRSLERLIALPDIDILYPAHGPAVTEPYTRMRELHAHREQRSRQALAALEHGESRIMPLVERIYAGVDRRLYPAAAQSLLAHLLALEAAGAIERGPGSADRAPDQVIWRLRTR